MSTWRWRLQVPRRPPLLAALSAQWHAAIDAGLGREDISAARVALARSRG